MKVLIAGSSGYVGQYLAWKLQDRHDLVLTDVAPWEESKIPWVYDALKVERTPAHTPKVSANVPFIQGDLMNVDFCKKITEGVDTIVHLSAIVDFENVVKCFNVNTQTTFQLLEACVQNDVKRALVASSINACGLFHCRVTDRKREWQYLPVDEDHPTDHEDAYSLSKYCNELNCAAWTNRTGITTAAFRFSGVFPPEWTESNAQKAEPTSAWDETLSEYVDLRDVVDGLIKALECETLPKTGVYQLSAPDTRMPEPTMEMIERFRPDLIDKIRKPLPGRTSMLSHDRASEAFGYQPQHCWKDV